MLWMNCMFVSWHTVHLSPPSAFKKHWHHRFFLMNKNLKLKRKSKTSNLKVTEKVTTGISGSSSVPNWLKVPFTIFWMDWRTWQKIMPALASSLVNFHLMFTHCLYIVSKIWPSTAVFLSEWHIPWEMYIDTLRKRHMFVFAFAPNYNVRYITLKNKNGDHSRITHCKLTQWLLSTLSNDLILELTTKLKCKMCAAQTEHVPSFQVCFPKAIVQCTKFVCLVCVAASSKLVRSWDFWNVSWCCS